MARKIRSFEPSSVTIPLSNVRLVAVAYSNAAGPVSAVLATRRQRRAR
jgi:hypothetical protein